LRRLPASATFTSDFASLHKGVDHPEIILNYVKPELTDYEKTQLSQYLIAFLRMREHDWIQYRNGTLDETTWNAYLSSITMSFSTPRTRKFWENISILGAYDLEFTEQVNTLLDEIPLSNEFYGIALFD